MTKTQLNNEYFEWMCRVISTPPYSKRVSYRKLLYFLYNTVFEYTFDMDGNRAEDGIELRYRFGYERDIEDRMIASCLDDRPCSMLEMLVALSIRCEEHIMDNPEIGNRTGQWFWGMIENLGLGHMTDDRFRPKYANDIIQRFLNHEYAPNGEGGLVTVHDTRRDLRKAEIWYQMMWYLNEVLDE